MEEKRQKYTIADVQQDKLLELGLDLKDAFIISYLRELSSTDGIIDMRIEGDRYIWLEYESLVSYLPVLKINNLEVIGRRFKKYEKLGLIKKHIRKTMTYGSYTFFHIEDNFYSLFEVAKISKTKSEREEIIKRMGLSAKSTEKSGGFDSKVGSKSTQKSVHNTPINNTPINNTVVAQEIDRAAASEDKFIKDLKNLLADSSIKNLNKNTLKNIITFSNNDITVVERAIAFMKLKNKSMIPSILVAILRDGDFKDQGAVTQDEVKRTDKVKFMASRLGEIEIKRLRIEVLKSIGFECAGIDDQLGNILCRKFNEYIDKGGTYV